MLLLAICWHDVWRTKRFPLNIISFIFNHSHEGTGSMSMFSQIAAVFDLDKRLIRSVRYAIRKHSGLQFKRLTTLEAKILKDMDSLEEWSLSRLKPIVDGNVFFNVMNSKAIRLAKFYFDNFMVRDSAKSFHFEWSKAEFTKRKEAYLVEARKLVEEAVKFKIIKK